MGSKENTPSNANSDNKNRRRFRRNNSNGAPNKNQNNKPKPVVREMKFYMHDSAQRKNSESFGKIKEAIILKIQTTFESPVDIVKSLRDGTKKAFTKPTMSKSTNADPNDKAAEDEQFREEWKIDYQIFCKEETRFEELWCKAFAVIWEKYCLRDLQVAIKEMSDFETTVRDNPVELLNRVEGFMHTPERAWQLQVPHTLLAPGANGN